MALISILAHQPGGQLTRFFDVVEKEADFQQALDVLSVIMSVDYGLWGC